MHEGYGGNFTKTGFWLLSETVEMHESSKGWKFCEVITAETAVFVWFRRANASFQLICCSTCMTAMLQENPLSVCTSVWCFD